MTMVKKAKPNYIIGTAGHIDHGKTALIKALTGINTDRLIEEQERGITIELGFAYFAGSDGHKYGIVDVPGHEKFIPTMLAGAQGFDVVMIVVAADDGTKPQTIEHFEILHLLRVPRAMFVITKIDLVETARIDEVREEIEILVHDSYLENSRIIAASSITGEGLDDVRDEISRLVGEGIRKIPRPFFRYPIDRSFTITGFGTVTTGTILSGNVKVDDEVVLIPGSRKLRIRNIEVHGDEIKNASAGQRTAINLPRIEKTEVIRSMELISPDLINQFYTRYYADIEFLSNKACRMKNFPRVRLFKGTMETMVTLVNISDERFEPKGRYLVDVSFKENCLVNSGERFIIRDQTNRYTLGGGEFILPATVKKSRMTPDHLDALSSFVDSELSEKILAALMFDKRTAVPISDLVLIFNRTNVDVSAALEKLVDKVHILPWMKNSIALASKLEEKKDLIIIAVTQYHTDNPDQPGLYKRELRDKLKKKFTSENEMEYVWKLLTNENLIVDEGEFLRDKNFKIKLSGSDGEIRRKMLDIYSDLSANTPKRERLPEILNIDQKTYLRVFQGLVNAKEVLMFKTGVYIAREAFERAENQAIKFLEKNGEITVAQFRDLVGTNRNMAVIMLEAMDSRGVTVRNENFRVLKHKK